MPIFKDPIAYSEDDDLRSRYARSIIQNPESYSSKALSNEICISKTIVQFWDNLDRIPEDVQECLDTWKPLENLGFRRLIFDDRKARQFILTEFGAIYAETFDLCYHPAMRCDYFRLCYILSKGGFYIDADEVYQGVDLNGFLNDNKLKLQPLCYDIQTGTMIEPESFMRDREYSSKRIFYFNNNPIISPAGHPVICLALERATRILKSCRVKPEIQSTTGPGNLTASLVRHALSQENTGESQDFLVLPEWRTISISRWPLSYRNDARNWRLSNIISPGSQGD